MAFCSTVGHASFQTARVIGPSTMERSSLRALADDAAAGAGDAIADGNAGEDSAGEAGGGGDELTRVR